MIVPSLVALFVLFLVAGMALALKRRDGRVRLAKIIFFDGDVPRYFFGEAKLVRWRLRDRGDLLLLAGAFLVLAMFVVIPLFGSLARRLAR